MATARLNQTMLEVSEIDTTGRRLTESGGATLDAEISSTTGSLRIITGSQQPQPRQYDHRRSIDLQSAAHDPDSIGSIAAALAYADIASTDLDNGDEPPPLLSSAPDDLTELMTARHGDQR